MLHWFVVVFVVVVVFEEEGFWDLGLRSGLLPVLRSLVGSGFALFLLLVPVLGLLPVLGYLGSTGVEVWWAGGWAVGRRAAGQREGEREEEGERVK